MRWKGGDAHHLLSSIVPRYARAVFRMAVGHSDDVDAQDAVEAVVAQCEEALGGVRPKAGLLFSTYDTDPRPCIGGHPEQHSRTSSSSVRRPSGRCPRCSASAMTPSPWLCSPPTPSTSPRGWARGVSADAGDRGEPMRSVRRWARPTRSLVCASRRRASRGDDPSSLLQEIRREIGHAVPVLGGGSGPRTEPGEPTQGVSVLQRLVLQDAAPVLLFSGPLRYAFGIDTGWQPVGRKGSVTDAGGGTIRDDRR